MDSSLPQFPPVEEAVRGSDNEAGQASPPTDYLVCENGQTFAGSHFLVDLWGVQGLDDPQLVEAALRDAADRAGATLLHVHVHEFGEGGVSGVAVLGESHISVHTWPEIDFAAFDVFMCGVCRPDLAVDFLVERLAPRHVEIGEHRRGLIR